MREIVSFKDLEHIINRRIDVIDGQGFTIPFVRFMSMTIKEVLEIFSHGWKYNPTI